MGDDARKFERNNGGVAAMEIPETNFSKKRKLLQSLSPSSGIWLRSRNSRCVRSSRGNSTSPSSMEDSGQVIAIFSSDRASPARSSSKNRKNLRDHRSLRSPDLEAEGFDFETEKTSIFTDNQSRDQTSPLSEVCGDSEELETPVKPPELAPVRRSPAAAKMPTAAEIEEFFAEAEKYEAKRFAEKYNYDIVKDVPLQGRYQWTGLC